MSSYAIVRIGGKQHQAEVGKTIVTEKLPYAVGDRVEFAEVLLIADGAQVEIGAPLVAGATVKGQIVEQFKGKKIIVFKYKPKQRYRRKQGHRQQYTRVLINSIGAEAAAPAKKTRSKKAAESEAAVESE